VTGAQEAEDRFREIEDGSLPTEVETKAGDFAGQLSEAGMGVLEAEAQRDPPLVRSL
jgi:hypothetical protein